MLHCIKTREINMVQRLTGALSGVTLGLVYVSVVIIGM